MSADAAVELEPAAEVPPNERCRGRPALPVRAARVRLESSNFGRRSDSRTWFDPATLRAHLRIQEERGSRNRYKNSTFCDRRVVVERATPNRGEEGLEMADWTHRYLEEYGVPAGLEAPLSEPSVLLYIVGRFAAEPAAANEQASWTVPVFSNRQTLLVRIERTAVTGVAPPPFSIAGGEPPDEMTLVRFDLTPIAVDADGTARDFELLGLEGAIEILALKELRLPVSISGRLPPAGRVTVRLRHVLLRDER